MSNDSRKLGKVIDDAADAIASVDAIAGTHLLGLALPVVLPMWCWESLVRDAERTGRTAASTAGWALAWPTGMVVALMLPAVLLAASGLASAWALILTGAWALMWFLVPFVVGGIVASRARRLGGFGVGFVGLTLGGLLVGVGTSLIALLGGLSGSAAPSGPLEALIWIPLMMFMVPVLTAAQFGVGVIIGSLAGEIRAR